MESKIEKDILRELNNRKDLSRVDIQKIFHKINSDSKKERLLNLLSNERSKKLSNSQLISEIEIIDAMEDLRLRDY